MGHRLSVLLMLSFYSGTNCRIERFRRKKYRETYEGRVILKVKTQDNVVFGLEETSYTQSQLY